MAASTTQDVWNNIKLKAMDVFDPDTKVVFSSLELEKELFRVESLGREASYEPRYHRIAWRDEMHDATLKEMQDVRYALSTLERMLADSGLDGAQKDPYFRTAVLQSTPVKEWAAVLREKFNLISHLLEVFSHETSQRWPMLDDEAKRDLLREIVRLKVYKEDAEQLNATSFRDDPLCKLSIFLACSDAMLVSMRQIQHHILRLFALLLLYRRKVPFSHYTCFHFGKDSEAPDHVSFNCAISACKREDNDAWHAAVTLFTGLFKRSVQPSHVTYSASSSVYASAAVWTVSMSLLEHLNCQGKFRGTDVDLSDFSNDPRLDPRSVTVLKLAYAKEQPRHARRIDSRTVNPWAPTVNQAVVSCAQVSVWQPALLAVAGAKRYGLFSPKIETYNSMATACLRCHAWSWGLLLLGEAQRNGLRVDAVSAAAAFSSCQTEQQWKVTSKILQHLRIGEEEGVPADLYTTSAAMTSLEKGGDRWQDAMELFISSTLARLSHNVVSFSAAITSCEAGQWWRGAFALLQRMREAGLRPNAFSYQAALSSTRENWRQGLSFFDSMQLAGIKWTVLGCQDLICACSHGGQAGFVRRLLRLVRQKKDWATGRLKGHSHGHSGHSCCGKPMGGVRTLKT
eukprot:symbB.v1.2.015244.t1/scaffold1132.1/size136097/15